MPQDEREIASVLRAGKRCYQAHPYFLERYGVRGEAFTRSDGGYLTTLADYPQSHVDDQVAWLAGVLASRGMPRWLMEEHLDFLYEELSVAVPERTADYAKLQRAAKNLREARQAWIAQADFEALVSRFDSTSGGGLMRAGELLVAAVCDECSGLVEAVPSLTNWLCDPGRFPPQWCIAASETLAGSRALAARRPQERT